MKAQRYSVNQHLIQNILSLVKAGDIAIPEIQRPFVWDSSKVRDLMDSLYQGYPIGYLIVWQNPSVRMKDGQVAKGKKILIDGQQRVTALSAAILGNYVINKVYKRVKIKIAFNPIEEKFEVLNSAIQKDNSWLPDIAKIFAPDVDMFEIVEGFCAKNITLDKREVFKRIQSLRNIENKQIGMIELDSDLDIETATEIFIRINRQGVELSQADFAMSKIASNETHNGPTLRKCIDYFCHMAMAPDFYHHIADADKDFTETDYFRKIAWLKNETEDLYDPKYTDLLRVAFTSEFNRGRLSDLVSLLSGRNFETRTYEEEIVKNSFESLERGVLKFINETNFNNFVMIIRTAGFINPSLIRSQNTLNFGYILYLKLKSLGYNSVDIQRYVRKWFVLSVLTGRYSGSPESAFDFDIRNIANKDFADFLNDIENAELSDAFGDAALVQNLNTSVSSSPYFNLYLAAQVKLNDRGFLSKDISVNDLISFKGDIHHIFPKDYLKKNGLKRGQYNQVANYVIMQSEINIKIGNKAPNIYFNELREQANNGLSKYGGIDSEEDLYKNLDEKCIPHTIFDMDINNYQDFLEQRRILMAKKIKAYYHSL